MAQSADHADSQKLASLKPAATHPELKASELRGIAPLSAAELETAADDGAGNELFGQKRAMDAVLMAIGVDGPGYNVFVSGLRALEERGAILRLLEERAAQMPTPGDWVYVNNFRAPEAPVALYLKAGQGRELHSRMQELVNLMIDQLPKAFRREDFDQERAGLRE